MSGSLQERLRSLRAPDEAGSEARAWDAVRSLYAERPPVRRRRRRPRGRLLLVPVLAALVGVLALTPAGAAVHRWLDRTLGVPHASNELFSLPAPGRILVSGPGGTWTISADGAKRRLGGWHQASWSPHGLYVAVTSRNMLTAVDARGVTRWAVARPAVQFARWFGPDGYRVAYLSGSTVRVIAGDGTGDRELAAGVLAVAPAWRPGHDYQLAYAGARGKVVARDADTGGVLWSRRAPSRVRSLEWSADGSRLLVVSRGAVVVYGGSGGVIAHLAAGRTVRDAALSPDGRRLALLDGRSLTVTSLPPLPQSTRVLFSGSGLRQLSYSPDGRWLLVSWPAADQWIFVRALGAPRLVAASRIAQQFGGGRAGARGFPALDGWCCTANGGAG
jgi:hypothetical protein